MILDFLQKRKKDIFFLSLLLILTVFSLRQFLPKGIFYAHDTVHHVTRLGNLREELEQGQFPVRMATQMAKGFSYPVFNFTYPLPYYFALAFNFLGFDLVTSIKMIFFLATIFSVLIIYRLLRLDSDEAVSFVGTTLYLYLPFRFLSIFVTAQIGIILAFVFAPLSLYFFRLLLKKNTKRLIVPLSLSLSALVLSHLISLIILLPVFLVYLLNYWSTIKNHTAVLKRLLFVLLLTFLLSAFYFLPAVLESRHVWASLRETVVFSDNFISLKQLLYSRWGYGFSNPGFDDDLSFQLGFAQWAVMLMGVLAVWIFSKTKKLRNYLIMSAILIFLMLPQSLFVWQSLAVLQKIQHPWRLLLGLGALIPLMFAEILKQISSSLLRMLLLVSIFGLAFYGNRNYQRPMDTVIRYEDQHYKQNTQQYYGSSDVAWEFLPKWAPNEPKETSNYVIDPGFLTAPALANNELSLDQTWDLNLAESQEIKLNVFYFPSWQLELNGQKHEAWPNEDGLITSSIPAGEHQLRLYLASTNLQKVANGLSLLGILISFILLLI